jgi:hypothetical protein
MTVTLKDLIAAANAKSGKKKRATAFKHRVTPKVNGKFVTVYLTDEGIEQLAVADFCRLFKINFIHPPNERKTSPQDGFMLKLLGLAPGTSDLIILTTPPFLPCKKGVVIEMKSATGKPTPDQIEWQKRAALDGFIPRICYSGREAIDFLQQFGYGQKGK